MSDPISSLGKSLIDLSGSLINGVGKTAIGIGNVVIGAGGTVIDVSGKIVGGVSNNIIGVGGTVINVGGKVLGVVSENLIDSTLELINPTDHIIYYAKKYIVGILLDDRQHSINEKIIDNLNYSIAQFLLTPLERSRQLLQTQHIIPNQKSTYLGAFDSVCKIFKETGFRSLFRGGLPGLLYYSYYFNINDHRQKSLITSYIKNDSKESRLNTLYNLLLFDLTHNFITYPLELIWTRRTCDTREKIDFNSCRKEAFHLISKKGITSLYTGYTYSLAFILSYYSLFTPFSVYYAFDNKHLLDIYIYLSLGILSLEFLLFPLDLIRRRKIIQNHESVGIEKYTNFLQTIKLIYKEEHIVGFYKGCFTRFNINLARRLFYFMIYYYTSTYTSKFTNNKQ